MSPLAIFVLRLESSDQLEDAYARLSESSDVESCIVESDRLQIRFAAPEPAAESLIERIYLGGGLVWSSRHAASTEHGVTYLDPPLR